MRFQYDGDKPITNLEYPEFWDVKLTGRCGGTCPWCYMNSTKDEPHYEGITKKVLNFFGKMNENQRPFQIAYGGGNPNEHPEFRNVLWATYNLGILPNYTTNGMGVTKDVLLSTIAYCGGVAVSTHPHIPQWRSAVESFHKLRSGILEETTCHCHLPTIGARSPDLPKLRVNLHMIIEGRESVMRAMTEFAEFKDKIDYFVLLPLTAQGRQKDAQVDSKFLFDTIASLPQEDQRRFAYGAKFYEGLKEYGKLKVDLYEPEVMSKFLDLKDMKVYGSSFDLTRSM